MGKVSIALVVAFIMAALSSVSLGWRSTNEVSSQGSQRLALDQYGGSTQVRCTNKTGHFILTKLGHRWWFCDPFGHGFIAMSVGNVVPNGNRILDCAGNNTYPTYLSKYGDANLNWSWQTLKRLTS